VSTLSLGIVT